MSFWQNLKNFFYNEDRAIASLGGAPPQETISSEVGRVERGQEHAPNTLEEEAALVLAHRLDTDTKIWGKDHTEKAIEHADELDKADDGHEQ